MGMVSLSIRQERRALSSLFLLVIPLALFAQELRDFKQEQDSILKELGQVKPWYAFGNEKYSLVPLAVLALDVSYYEQDENSFSQMGDLGARYEPGQIRAMRFGVVGTIGSKNPWRYIIAGAYRAFDQGFNADSASDFSLYDLRVDIPTAIGTFAIGKMKEPVSIQRRANLIYLGGFERSINIDGLTSARNNGITFTRNFWKDRIYWSIGAFRAFNYANEVKWKDATTSGMTALAVNPFHDLQEHHDLHLGASFRVADFKGGGKLRQHPEAYFAGKFIETPFLEGEQTRLVNLELVYRWKSLIVSGEMTRLLLEGPALGTPVLYGHYVQADYLLTGERRSYLSPTASFSPPRPRKSVQDGGPGALELSIRYSALYTSQVDQALGDPGTSGDLQKIGAYLTWYPTLLSKFQLGYNFTELDRFGIIGHTHIFQIRFAILIG